MASWLWNRSKKKGRERSYLSGLQNGGDIAGNRKSVCWLLEGK